MRDVAPERRAAAPLTWQRASQGEGITIDICRSVAFVDAHGYRVAVTVDRPASDDVIGAIVVVMPPGRESLLTDRALRTLAAQAARQRLVAARCWMGGDGDSSPLGPDADVAGRWRHDVQAVLMALDAALPGLPRVVLGTRLAAAVLTSGSAEPACGPGALWTELADDLAEQGVVSLRVDRHGAGELADPDALCEPNPFAPETVDDVVDAVRWWRGVTGLPVLGVGVCVGGWHWALATRRAPVDRVLVLSVGGWQPHATYYRAAALVEDLREHVRARRRAATRRHCPQTPDAQPQARAVGIRPRPASRRPLASRLGATVRDLQPHVPAPVRGTLARMALAQSPSLLLGSIDPHTAFEVHLGRLDEGPFVARGGVLAHEPALGPGDRSVQVWDDLDHGLLSLRGRRRARTLVLEAAARVATTATDTVGATSTGCGDPRRR